MPDDDQGATMYPFTPPPPSQDAPLEVQPAFKRRHGRSSRLTKTAAGLVLILGAGAGVSAVVLSATSGGDPAQASTGTATTSTSPGTTTPSNLPAPPGPRFFRRGVSGSFAFGGPMAGPVGLGPLGGLGRGGVIHATYTIKDPKGNYETIDSQVGTVKAVSSSSITVESADGFSQTYTVGTSTIVNADYDGIMSIKVGDNVSVTATVSGTTVTAQQVLDTTQVQANRKSWAPGGAGPGGSTTLPPSTTTTPSSTTTTAPTA